jgi:hypothetical protein
VIVVAGLFYVLNSIFYAKCYKNQEKSFSYNGLITVTVTVAINTGAKLGGTIN